MAPKKKAKSRPNRKGKSKSKPTTKAAAAAIIQQAFRSYRGRCRVYDAYRAQYTKFYDEYEHAEVYRNNKTLNKSEEKPSFLGDRDIPIVDTTYEAPYEYNPGYDDTSKGYLLMISCNDFPLGNWTEVDMTSLDADYDLLSTVLVNDYICRFHPENIKTLKNPTVLEVTDALHALRKVCQTNGFLTVYIATHIITIVKGEKDKREKNYFVFRDSTWDTPMETASTCLSVTNFSTLLNRILCRQKTVIMNYAHVAKPKPSIFPSSKILYPHNSFLTKLAHSAKCAVIGSCSSGTRVRDLLKNIPSTLPSLILPTPPPLKLIPTKQIQLKNDSQEKPKNEKDTEVLVTKQKKSWFARKPKVVHAVVNTVEARAKLMTDWNVQPPKELVYSDKPVKPGATWGRNREEDNQIVIELPDSKVRNNFMRRLILWNIRTSLVAPVHLVKKGYRRYCKYTATAPNQTSLVSEGHTLFGKALFQALNGGAMDPDHRVVTVEELFKHIHQTVKHKIDRMKAIALSALVVEPDKEPDAAAVAEINKINQSPILVVPHGTYDDYLSNPVCFRCSPAPAPEKPFIVKVGNNTVLLEWYNPPFSGVQPTKYKIFMKNKSRNFNNWNEVYYAGDIMKTQFLVRDLPMGVSCQFKVKAWNNGGWGPLSEETIFVTPGEETEHINYETRWKRLQQGGLLAILDHLELTTADCEETRKGLHMIVNYGQNGAGFKNARISMRVAQLAIKCIRNFSIDADVLSLSFVTLGWCIRGKAERKSRQLCIELGIVELVDECTKAFRMDGKVMNAITWLRGTMMKYLTVPPEIEHHATLNPQPKLPGDLGDEEEDEFAYLDDENEEELDEADILEDKNVE